MLFKTNLYMAIIISKVKNENLAKYFQLILQTTGSQKFKEFDKSLIDLILSNCKQILKCKY